MTRTDLIGRRFGYREQAKAWGTSLQQVEVVKVGPKPSRQVRIRWLGGEWEGLEAWVPLQRLVVPWEEVGPFIIDEERFLHVFEAPSHVKEDSTLHRAVGIALGALASDVWFGVASRERTILRIDRIADAAVELRMTLDVLLAEPLAYLDRYGVYRAPFGTAENIAREVCRRHGTRVLGAVAQERDAYHKALLTGVYQSSGTGDAYRVSRDTIDQWIAEQGPAWELVTQWCGTAAQDEFRELIALRAEVARLRGQIESLATWLKVAGHPVKAAQVFKALGETTGPSEV